MYSVDDRGATIRFRYFLGTEIPTPDQFRTLAERGGRFQDDPVAVYRSQGLSTWATEQLAHEFGRIPRVNRGRWRFIAGLDLTTDGIAFRIERTGNKVGHFTVFGDTVAFIEAIRVIVPL